MQSPMPTRMAAPMQTPVPSPLPTLLNPSVLFNAKSCPYSSTNANAIRVWYVALLMYKQSCEIVVRRWCVCVGVLVRLYHDHAALPAHQLRYSASITAPLPSTAQHQPWPPHRPLLLTATPPPTTPLQHTEAPLHFHRIHLHHHTITPLQ